MLRSGGDGLLPKPPKLKPVPTLATKLKLTPREPYSAGVGFLNLRGISAYLPHENSVIFRDRTALQGNLAAYQVQFLFFPPVAGKRYLIELGIQPTANLEVTLYTNYGRQEIRNPGPSIPILFDAQDTQLHVFSLNGSAPWHFHFCEVTTLE